jgi:hypothetical protein
MSTHFVSAEGLRGIRVDPSVTSIADGQVLSYSAASQTLVAANPVAGTNGATWYSVTGSNPAGGTGVVGDFCLRVDTGGVFKKTGASAWTLELTVKGADGINTPVTPPVTAAAAGVAGQWALDSDFVYFCVSSGVWLKAAIATW